MQVASRNSLCSPHKRGKRIPEIPKNPENHDSTLELTLLLRLKKTLLCVESAVAARKSNIIKSQRQPHCKKRFVHG